MIEEIRESLSHTWETWIEFSVPGFGLARLALVGICVNQNGRYPSVAFSFK